MVVYPSGFVNTADVSLENARIGYQSYTRDSTSSVTVSSETAEGPSDAPLRPDTAEYWLASADPATWILDMGSAKPIDYVGIAGHELGTHNALVEVHVSDDASTWEAFSSDIRPSDDSALMFLGDQVQRRYCRVRVTAGDSPQTPSRIAVINVGVALAMQRQIYGGHKPITLSRQTVLSQSLSKGGQFVGQTYRRNGLATSVAFRHLTPAWYRSQFDLFVQHARKLPYFFAWRPLDYPLEVAYVWTGKDIAPTNMGVIDLMQVAWDMQGVGVA